MSERVPEPVPQRTTYLPVEVTPELARKNVRLGLILFGVFVLLFGGTVGVAFLYLALD